MRLAVVVPTLNEEACLERAISTASGLGDLVVITDGGSTDRTCEIARAGGTEVVEGSPGRGVQINRGVARAFDLGADSALVLHADTTLAADCRQQIARALEAGAVGGGFRVRFDQPSAWMRLGARIVNARTRLLRAPLGDQGQFFTAAAFRQLAGYPDWPILEDLRFIRRLRRLGRIDVLAGPVTTAARRFERRGIARTIATNWLIFALYFLGVKPERLARLYRHVR